MTSDCIKRRKNSEIRVVYLFAYTFAGKLKRTDLAVFIYNIILLFYRAGITVASLGNKKAKQWLQGRKNFFQRLDSETGHNRITGGKEQGVIWMHCSSLGEFEQGRPVLEQLKSKYPEAKVLLTFFSPSGYEIRKNYEGADYVYYLPLDSARNAKLFFNTVNPSLVLFVKYDFWYYYLLECRKRNIPLLLVSGIFRKDQPFFNWFGSFHRKMLSCFTHFFVQDNHSKELLQSVGLSNSTVSGDTRFDRVKKIADSFEPIEILEKFCYENKVIVAGSTWPGDEKIIREAIFGDPQLKLVIAPHEIDKNHLQHLKIMFPGSVFFSKLQLPTPDSRLPTPNSKFPTPHTIIIDNIGMLSRIYRYATVTYIGGGFNSGIHNILEAAIYGKPVLFGPKYEKSREAKELIQYGGAIVVNNSAELKKYIDKLFEDYAFRKEMEKKSLEYMKTNSGATEKIIHYIQENLLLTN